MNITIKLYATLGDYLPLEARRNNRLVMQVGDDTTVTDVIAPLNMPEKLVHLVLVNGHFVPPAARNTRKLTEGDVLAIWPPIAGG
ncbi:MAG: MoaD/ThiS family protein [Sterolibacteriaceae bacterium]|nr:MoaD/ThiS family protein [Candidatus Methylophosphatis haderslevensis]